MSGNIWTDTDPEDDGSAYDEDDYRYHEQVALAMRHSSKPCIPPECDLDSPCKRHARTAELVFRIVSWKK